MSAPAKPTLSVVARPTCAIVGAGHAGVQAALALREHGFRGRVVLLGGEPHLPYMRPPLSKRFLGGTLEEARLAMRPAELFAAQGIELKLGVAVEAIDVAAARLELSSGLRLPYDQLLLATGARARAFDVPGSRGPGIHSLRTLDDSRRLRAEIGPGRRVVVIGGGYVGLEVAATAAALGARVRVLELGERVLGRVTTAAVSAFFERAHREHGVDVRCATRVTGFEGTDRLEAVVCDGARYDADVAVVGIGAEPNVDLARAAGLACDDGIVVDEHCRTSAPGIFAAGDCTRHPSRLLGRRVRLESVQNAVEQAGAAARNLCGEAFAYDRVPTFWSQQYDLNLQSAGFAEGCDAIEPRGDPARRSFALLYRRGGTLIGVDAVNLPAEYQAARRRIGAPHTDAPGHVRTA